MTLDHEERARTSAELRANLELTGLSRASVAAVLGLSIERLEAVLAVCDATHPSDVWLLRDFLDQVARERRLDAEPWTVLTDQSRVMATHWFELRSPPPTPPA